MTSTWYNLLLRVPLILINCIRYDPHDVAALGLTQIDIYLVDKLSTERTTDRPRKILGPCVCLV